MFTTRIRLRVLNIIHNIQDSRWFCYCTITLFTVTSRICNSKIFPLFKVWRRKVQHWHLTVKRSGEVLNITPGIKLIQLVLEVYIKVSLSKNKEFSIQMLGNTSAGTSHHQSPIGRIVAIQLLLYKVTICSCYTFYFQFDIYLRLEHLPNDF